MIDPESLRAIVLITKWGMLAIGLHYVVELARLAM